MKLRKNGMFNMKKLNAERLMCPMPVIKVQNEIRTMNKDDILEVVCTDPGTVHDIPAWCRINRHTVLEIIENDFDIKFIIKVGQ
jgi:tRNA 2-thiouridine synthesizing protein A